MTLKSGMFGAAMAVGIALPALAGAAQRASTDVLQTTDMATAGVVIAQDTAGKAIFTGKGLCYACHGPDAKGTPLAPDLTDDKWLNIDGSVEAIVKLVTAGVPTPKEAAMPMPPKGGATLSDAEVQAVAQYVYSLSHPK